MWQPVRGMRRDGSVWATAGRTLGPFLDITIAVVATASALGALFATDVTAIDSRLQEPDAIAVVGTAAATVSLYWRRSHPTASYSVFAAGCVVVTSTDHYIGLLSVILLFSLYSLAAHGPRRNAAIALASTLAVFAVLAAIDIPDLHTSDLLQAWALLITAWAVGDAIRSRRGQHREQLLAAERDAALAREQATRAVVEERLRIARELHDVVAHSMSLIAVQAGVGAHVIRTDVDAAERALQVVAQTSREALAQTRSMLGILREEDDPVNGPVPHGVGGLPALVAVVGSAGLDVDLQVTGTATHIDAAVDLAVYRIVQESLTNVLKHGGPVAHVRVAYSDDRLDIDVVDAGRGGAGRGGAGREGTGRGEVGRGEAGRGSGSPGEISPGQGSSGEGGGGHGLIGLLERAHLVGGTLESGETPDGGFRVHATLPHQTQPHQKTLSNRENGVR